MARKFNHSIFHGEGHKSQILYDVVVERLEEEAHSNLCGLQQGILINSPEYKTGINDIQDCIKDIAASLGFEVTLKPITESKNKNEVSLNYNTLNDEINKLIEEKYRNVPFGVKPKKLRPKNEETSRKSKRGFFEHDEDEE